MKHYLVCLLGFLLLAVQGVTAQNMVTVDRNRLQKERAQRAKQSRQSKKSKAVAKATSKKGRVKASKSRTTTRRRSQPVRQQATVERYFYVNGGTYTNDAEISYLGEVRGYNISTNDYGYCTVTHIPSWAKVITQSESHISIDYAANPTHQPRTDYLEFLLNGRSARINITQEAKFVNIEARLSGVYLQHNIPSSRGPELVIKGNVQIKGGMNEPCCVVVFFSDGYDSSYVKAHWAYSDYANDDGTLMAYQEFTPNTDDPTRFDFRLHIPNQAFAVYDKKKLLHCYVNVYRLNNHEFLCCEKGCIYLMVRNKRGKIKTREH